jgi:hypothetical protein
MDNHRSGTDEKGGHCSRLSRRKFLKLTAMAGLSVGAIGVHKRSDSAPSVQPGDASNAKVRWVPTSCLNCPARCGITVKVARGKAVQIKGNRFSLISEGEICPRGHNPFPDEEVPTEKGEGDGSAVETDLLGSSCGGDRREAPGPA